MSDRPAFCFQGHPEASPGPRDVDYLFDRFAALMGKSKAEGGWMNAQREPSSL